MAVAKPISGSNPNAALRCAVRKQRCRGGRIPVKDVREEDRKTECFWTVSMGDENSLFVLITAVSLICLYWQMNACLCKLLVFATKGRKS